MTAEPSALPGRLLLHIIDAAAWAEAADADDGQYRAGSLDDQGFIHLSTPDQVVLAADTHYRGASGLVLLCLDADRLDPDRLRFEVGAPPNSHLTFPHLYGPLPLAAVTGVLPFPAGADGRFQLPPELAR